MELGLKEIADVSVVLAAIAAFWAAREARNAAKAARDSLEGQLVYTAISEYFDPSMSDALQSLRSWKKTHGGEFAKAWLRDYKHKPSTEESIKVNYARRHVKQYFVKAERLYSDGLIGLNALKAIANFHGINLLYDVVAELDKALNPHDPLDTYEQLQSLVGRYKSPSPRA